MNIDLTDFARLFGSALAFVLVLYIGIIFYRRESNFSDEYSGLIGQYKERNEQLMVELITAREECKREIAVLKSEMQSKQLMFTKQIADLVKEIEILKKK